jgi:vanillate monooxygenase ferredoxin subunit
MSGLWKTLEVAAKKKEADDIVSFELIDPAGEPLPRFTAGAHIEVEIAPDLVRQYSLCNAPRERRRYLIGVLRERASRGGSTTLVDTVEPGAFVRTSEPRNHFALDASATRVVLMAGGIGITPILCMAEHLAATSTPFELHYCTRSRARAAFWDRISRSPFSNRTRFYFDDAPGSLSLDLSGTLNQPRPGDHLYVCGPNGFIEAVLGEAVRAGWRREQLHKEFFTPTVDPPRADVAFEVEIASTGTRFTVPANRSVLDVLLANGIEIPMSCEQGVCGTCVTRVLNGVPDHRDVFMTDEEHARNDQFTPCCSRAKSDVLVLDL